MKAIRVVAIALLICGAASGGALPTSFTYQGKLNDAGAAANAAYDFRFDLYDDPDFGTLLATVSLNAVPVAEGIFTVDIDYMDPTIFAAGPVYLEIRVGDAGSGPNTVLSPRQLITSAPLALHAQSADQALTTGMDAVDSISIIDGTITAVDVDTSSLQQRVSGTCNAGAAMRVINQVGSVVCETDDDTLYSAGAGLSLNTTTFDVDFGGDGVATIAARSDHLHDGDYGGGSQLIQVNGDGSASQNGAALEAAIAGIGDASAAKPYAVQLGPGIYDVGADGVTMQPFVNLRGTSTASTIITSVGEPSNFKADNGTLIMADDVLVEALTIRNEGGVDTDAIGVLGSGAGWQLRHARIEISKNGADLSAGFSGADLSGAFVHSGEMIDVDIVVDEGNGIGFPFGSGDLDSLRVDNCRITVLGAGIGIGDGGFDGTGSSIVVTNTTIQVLGGGTGASGTFDTQLYRNVTIEVEGGVGSNAGMAGFGSGFKPIVDNSRITVTGADSAGIRTNNGRPVVHGSTINGGTFGFDVDTTVFSAILVVSNSTIVASTGFFLKTTTGAHSVRIDHSTLDVSTGFRTSADTGVTHTIRVGSSKLDATGSNIVIDAGLVNAVCAASYHEGYAPLNTDCT